MKPGILVYISGPMTAKAGRLVEENVIDGLRLFLACLEAGIPAYLPHLCGMFPSAWSVIDYETWLAYDFAVLDRCTHVLTLPNWQASSGAVREVEYALERGLPVCKSLDDLKAVL